MDRASGEQSTKTGGMESEAVADPVVRLAGFPGFEGLIGPSPALEQM